MEKDDYIFTDDKIMINLKWINVIRKVNDCYRFKLNMSSHFEFEVCRGNPNYPKVDKRFGFSKK